MFETLEESDGVEFSLNQIPDSAYRCEFINGKLMVRNLTHGGLVIEILFTSTLNRYIKKGDWIITSVPDRISEEDLWE